MFSYVELEDHPTCFVPGCSNPRKLVKGGRYKGGYAQTCELCAGDTNLRTAASRARREWLEDNGQPSPPEPTKYNRGKIRVEQAREIYNSAEYLLKNGLGIHDDLVGEAHGVSGNTVMRLRLTPSRWKIPLPPLKAGRGRPRRVPGQIAKVKQYLQGQVNTEPTAPTAPVLPPTESTNGEDDIDAALAVIGRAISSRDTRIESLEFENNVLRQGQTKQVYNRIAEMMLRRFGNQLLGKEGDELEQTLEQLMKQTPAQGRTKQ